MSSSMPFPLTEPGLSSASYSFPVLALLGIVPCLRRLLLLSLLSNTCAAGFNNFLIVLLPPCQTPYVLGEDCNHLSCQAFIVQARKAAAATGYTGTPRSRLPAEADPGGTKHRCCEACLLSFVTAPICESRVVATPSCGPSNEQCNEGTCKSK